MRDPYQFLRACRAAVVVLGVTLLAGCGEKPSAPPLQDGPVYQDRREGFRFFVPDGWTQRARGNIPAGKVTGERMLAEYKCTSTDSVLRVTVADVPLSTPLTEYVSTNTKTGEDWKLGTPAQDFTINGVPAARITYQMKSGKDEIIREIIAFRRGERVYFFRGFYAASDQQSRKAIQKAVDTVVW